MQIQNFRYTINYLRATPRKKNIKKGGAKLKAEETITEQKRWNTTGDAFNKEVVDVRDLRAKLVSYSNWNCLSTQRNQFKINLKYRDLYWQYKPIGGKYY